MRYISLNKSRLIIKMLFIIFIQNLYKRFNKKKIIFISNKIFDFSINQNIIFDYQKSHFECLNSTVKSNI